MKEIKKGPVVTVGLVAIIIALLAAAGTLPAQEIKPTPPPKKWESVATAGLTLTRGNSRTFLGSLSLNTKRSWTEDELLFGANAGYGDNTTTAPGGGSVKTT